MNLDEISNWFISLGLHPLIGGALAGSLITFMLRGIFKGRDRGVSVGGGDAPAFKSVISPQVRSMISHNSTIKFINNGQELSLSDDESCQILQLIRDGKKIEAIKILRETSGLGLAEAKDLVEVMEKARL